MVSLFHFSRDDQAPRCGFAIGTGYRLIGALLLGIIFGFSFTGAIACMFIHLLPIDS
jgi:hypothetical protein